MNAESSILGEVTFSTMKVFTLDIIFGHWLLVTDELLTVACPIARGVGYTRLIVSIRHIGNIVISTKFLPLFFFIIFVTNCKI
jgi:hypothetical protein